jgi:hypothetical protein
MSNSNETNQIFSFKTKTVGIYVQSCVIGGKKLYQGLYDSGHAITEMDEDKKAVIDRTMKAVQNTTELLIVNNRDDS